MEMERLLVYCSLMASRCTHSMIPFPQTEKDSFLLECITQFDTSVSICVPPCRTPMLYAVGASQAGSLLVVSLLSSYYHG